MQMVGTAAARKIEYSSPLAGERVAFTGRLAAMDRRQAERLVRQAGGTPVGSVSRRTSLLVVGMHGWPVLPDGSISHKLRQAENLRGKGQALQIDAESAFLERLGLRPARSGAGPRSCTIERACRILGVEEEIIRRCEQFGLVRTERGSLDFQDLVSLRSVLRLIRDGITPAAIASGLARLAPFLPEAAQPLSQVRLIAEGSTLLAELQGLRLDARGQLHLDFRAGPGSSAPSIRLPRLAAPGESPDHWFETALDHEDAGSLTEAENAYRKALELDPRFAEAHFNLANLKMRGDDLAGAEAGYRAAVSEDPEMACGWYNLGYTLAEQGFFGAAAEVLVRALELLPAYADAHFNLALCLDELGRRLEAARHWLAYLRLAPDSEWSEFARRRLDSLAVSPGE